MNRVCLALLISSSAMLAQEATGGIDAASLDRSANPCVDFYQFACGGWQKANPIPPDQTRWGRFDELVEGNRQVLRHILEAAAADDPKRSAVEREVGDFYTSCMDEPAINKQGAEPVRPLLKQIAAIPTKQGLTDELIALHHRNVDAFFSFGSTQDAKDATNMIAEVDQGGLSLPDRDYYLKTDPKSVELRTKFVAYVEKMFELLGDSSDVARARSQVVLKIETELANGSLDLVGRRDPNKIYHKYTVAELISLSPGVDWQKFFTGLGLNGLSTLNVSFPPFVRQIESVLVQNPLENLKTYLAWHVLNTVAPWLSEPFVQQNWDFYARTLSGAEQRRPRWKRCTDSVDRQLGDALGQKYVDRTFGAEGKQRTLAMVADIEASMGRDIQSLDWMSESTKKQALIKLHAVTNKIGYPDKWKDYSAVEIARDDALGNHLRLREWAVNYDLNKIGKPVDKGEWSMSPPTVNAYYSPQMNDINFPAGILQPPFYSNNRDAPVNFGAVGAIIGHELTHGFDDEGRQFDAQGNLRDWWTADDAKRFEERAACIADEYGEFTAIEDVKLNGKLTLGENAADNGGVSLALMSLRRVLASKNPGGIDGFTPEQRFFLGFGQIWCENIRPELARMLATVDPHSPGRLRVNGVLSNNPDFQKAFSCKTGQPMVRAKACRIW